METEMNVIDDSEMTGTQDCDEVKPTVDYDGEETRELDEFNLAEDEREEADAIVGQIMADIYERLEQDYCDEYCDRLYADTEKERYIGRKLQVLQIESFCHFCQMSEGFKVQAVGYPNPDLSFPYRHL